MPTFDTPKPIVATIDLSVGDVRISAGDGATTVVDVRPSDTAAADDRKAAEQTRVEMNGDKLLVKAPKVRSWLTRSTGPSIDITIELPAGSQVHGTGSAADFSSDGPLGMCRIRTSLGDIRLGETAVVSLKSGLGSISVDHAGGDVEVTAGSGEVRLGAIDGDAMIRNSNGDTWIGVAGGDLRLKAANGSIAVDVAHGGVDAKSSNGSVRVGEVARGSVVLESRLGDIEVGIPEGTAAWLDVEVGVGKVRNSLEATAAPNGDGETVEVRARTSAGDIVIRRP